PDRDGVAEKLREGIHTADLTTSTVGRLSSSNNAVAQVNNARGFEHPVEFQGGPACLEAVEESLTRAEDHCVHLKIDLVDKACRDRLPGARGSPRDRYRAATRRGHGLGVCGPD